MFINICIGRKNLNNLNKIENFINVLFEIKIFESEEKLNKIGNNYNFIAFLQQILTRKNKMRSL